VLKGTKLTDDLWRALALTGTFLLNDEFCKKNLKNRLRRIMQGGLVAANMLSQGGTQSYGGNGVPNTAGYDVMRSNRVAAASGAIGGGVSSQLNAMISSNVFARR
jgi:hypothetical protein